MSTENIELVPLEYFKEASELGDTLKSDHSKIKNALSKVFMAKSNYFTQRGKEAKNAKQ